MSSPVTIAWMRSQQIRHVDIWCQGKRESGWPCGNTGKLPIEGWAEALTMADLKRRLVCSRCGAIGECDVRPAWAELYVMEIPKSYGMMPPAPKK